MITNLKKIFLVKPTPDPTLNIFNGVRVLSIGWVILGHTYLMRLSFAKDVSYMGNHLLLVI